MEDPMAIETILKTKGRGVATIESSMPVGEAICIMRRSRADALVVSGDDGDIKGLINRQDLIRALKSHGVDPLMPRTVAAIMRPVGVSCRPHESLRRVMTRMMARGIAHIPVVDDTGLRGVVSLAEIMKHRLEKAQAEAAALRESVVLPV
jgi:CBS domain-containing protein